MSDITDDIALGGSFGDVGDDQVQIIPTNVVGPDPTTVQTVTNDSSLGSAFGENGSPEAITAINEAALSAAQAAVSEVNAAASATEAAGSATSAATSAANAATSESNAATSASSASISATSAATSAAAASTSATNAATSETNAAGSATAAATSANEASNSAVASADSATNAAASETSATLSATSAQTSASTASTAASNATASASSATTSANSATTSASNAATSATNAATSATNAATSASSATTSATAAATSATQAATSAAAAAISEDNVAVNAANAATSESNAATSATTAQTAATNATNSANEAASSAANAATSATAAAASESSVAADALSASLSATSATTSATTAQTAANNAADSETAAASSAVLSADSASSSSLSAAASLSSANNAASSATDASVAEVNAEASATNAASSAVSSLSSSLASASSAASAASSATSATASETNATASATAAAGSATSAATSATSAAASATSSSTSANDAATSATQAGISEANAASSATSADASATAAAASATTAQGHLLDFEKHYLGDYASAPTLDNQGNPLSVGALYFNTIDNGMYVWSGSVWITISDTIDYAPLTGADFTGEVTAPLFTGSLRGNQLFKAQAGEALTKGVPVYISGVSGNTPIVKKADSDDPGKMPAFGLAGGTANLNAAVDIVTYGQLENMNTSAYTLGQTLYVDTVPGGLVSSAPSGENSLIQNIGKVERVHASAGAIFVAGAGRTNATPNLNEGKFFLGNALNKSVSADFSDTVAAQLAGTVTLGDVYSTGSVEIDGNLTVHGTTVTVNATELAIADNMIYLNEGSVVTNPDLGIAGGYNDGTYAHAGIFRDATDGIWKVYDGYLPEPDASPYIDITDASFTIADMQVNTLYAAGGNSGNWNTAYSWGNHADAGYLTSYTDNDTTYTAGSGLALTGTVFSNTAPDQTVTLLGSGATTVTGAYPNFTISSTDTNTVYTHPTSHSISFITGLQTALDGKVDDSQVLTNVPAGALFTDTVYTHPSSHPISFITGLQTALDNKVDDSQVLTNVPAGAVFTDTVYTLPFTDYSSNWNAAYDWGDHALAGYANANHVHNYLPLSGGTLTGTLSSNSVISTSSHMTSATFYNSGSYNILNAAQNGWHTAINRGSGDNFTINALGGYQINGTTVIDSSRNISNINAISIGQDISGMDTTNLDLDIVNNASIRGSSSLYFGVTTNNYNSWKTRISSDNTSTMSISGAATSINNFGYGSSVFGLFNTSGLQILGNTAWHAGNDGAGSGLDADLLDGYNTSTSATANTVVVREGGGHIYGNYILGSYFNASAGNSENPTIGQIWTQSTGDNYLRKSTPAHFASQMSQYLVQTDGSNPAYIKVPSNYTGNLNSIVNAGVYFTEAASGISNNPFGSTGSFLQFGDAGGSDVRLQFYAKSSLDRIAFRNQWGNGNWGGWHEFWTTANDGSGSGLDADTVDGWQASNIVKGGNGKGTTNIAFGSSANTDSGFYDVYSDGTPTGTWYSMVNMAHYGGNHGHQIAGSFYAAGDLYNRNNNNGSLSAWAKIWNTANDGSGSGLDADLLDGLQLHTGRNNEANKVVRTDANGYIQAGWINTDSGDSGITNRLTRIYSSGDNYLRYSTLTDFKVHMGLSAKNSYSRRIDYTSDANYHVGSMGHSGIGANEVFHGGSGFFDIWSSTNLPPSTSHVHGFNALHYTTNSYGTTGGNAYGIQVAGQYNQGGTIFARGCSGGSFSGWAKLWSDSNDGSGSGLDADYLDGNQSSFFADKTNTQTFAAEQIYTGMARVFTGSIAESNTSNGLVFDGNYQTGQYRHRLRKRDDGNGLPLYLDYASSTANSYSPIVRFGGGGTYKELSVYGDQEITGQLLIDQNIASPSNYYNGLQVEVRATSGTAGIGLHRNGYSHVGIYTNASNRLDFDFNAGDVIMNYNAGTLWGSGNDGSGSGLDADLLDGQQPSALSVNYANTAGSAGSLPTLYAGGQQTNPQVYFNYLTGLKVAMTGYPNVWSDTLWINGYSGGDVENMCALHLIRNGQPRMWISSQSNRGTSYGTAYEFWSSYNDGSGSGLDADLLDGYNSDNFLGKFGNSYYQANNWIQLTAEHGLYMPSINNAHFYPNGATSYGTWRIIGSRNGYTGIHLDHGNVTTAMYDGGGNGGEYNSNWGWYTYFHRDNGCLGVAGSSTSSSYGLYEQGGGIYSTGNITAYSDRRVKENIRTIDNALETVEQMRGVYYNRIDDEEKKTVIGFIAQEVNEIEGAKPLVTYAEDVDQYGVAYGNTAGLLVEAVKQLSQQVKDLQNEIKELKNA